MSTCFGKAAKKLLVSVWLLCGTITQAAQQQQIDPWHRVKGTYKEVVDLLFRVDGLTPADFHHIEYRVLLRFLPSFAPESQVVIVKQRNGAFRITYYFLPPQSPPVSQDVNKALDVNVEAQALEIAAKLKVEKREVSSNPKIEKLVSSFFRTTSKPDLGNAIQVDGTIYQLWFEATQYSSYYFAVGPNEGSGRGMTPLLLWMNEIRNSVVESAGPALPIAQPAKQGFE